MSSPRLRQFTSASHNEEQIFLALSMESQLAKLRSSRRNFLIWTIPVMLTAMDIIVLRHSIAQFFVSLIIKLDVVRKAIPVVELSLASICALNLIFYAIKAIGLYCNCYAKTTSNLSQQQVTQLGLSEENSYSNISHRQIATSSSPSMKHLQSLSQWLSAMRIGSCNTSKISPANANNQSANSQATSFHSLPSVSFYPSGSGNTSLTSERWSSHSIPLKAKVGSRLSLHSRPSSSFQTSKQVDELLEKNSHSQSPLESFETNGVSYVKCRNRRSLNISSIFMPSSSKSSYQVGTSHTDEDQVKGVREDENSVVSLVTGSRMIVSDNRVSLSPIPLNRLDVTNELSSADGVLSDKDISSEQHHLNDNIMFRVLRCAERDSPKGAQTSPSVRRSDSLERRRATSGSPRIGQIRSFLNISSASSGTNAAARIQFPTTSSGILNEYQIDAEYFNEGERRLRMWFCQTILRPLIANVDQMNEIFANAHSQLHLGIGQTLVESLQVALSTKNDLLGTQLPYIIPYLKVHDKQAYILKRARELADDVCMKNYRWNDGGSEVVEKNDKESSCSYSCERPWGEHLPCDAQLVWFWFCVYMDARMTANSLVNNIQLPFSSVYHLKKPTKPSLIQCAKKSFYIYQSLWYPPHFELVIDGGRERFDVGRGSKNLWRTLLLFIQHSRLFNDSKVGNIRIDEKGVNIACIFD